MKKGNIGILPFKQFVMLRFGTHGLGLLAIWLVGLLLIEIAVYSVSGNKEKEEPSAKEILDKHYVDGKIDTEEYQKYIKALQ